MVVISSGVIVIIIIDIIIIILGNEPVMQLTNVHAIIIL